MKPLQMKSADPVKPPRNQGLHHELHKVKLKNEAFTLIGELFLVGGGGYARF